MQIMTSPIIIMMLLISGQKHWESAGWMSLAKNVSHRSWPAWASKQAVVVVSQLANDQAAASQPSRANRFGQKRLGVLLARWLAGWLAGWSCCRHFGHSFGQFTDVRYTFGCRSVDWQRFECPRWHQHAYYYYSDYKSDAEFDADIYHLCVCLCSSVKSVY